MTYNGWYAKKPNQTNPIFLIIPSAPIIIGIAIVLECYILATSISEFLYFESLSNYFADTILSEEIVCDTARIFKKNISLLYPVCYYLYLACVV